MLHLLQVLLFFLQKTRNAIREINFKWNFRIHFFTILSLQPYILKNILSRQLKAESNNLKRYRVYKVSIWSNLRHLRAI